MTALNALPLYVQGLLTFIVASWFLYMITYKIKTFYGKLGMSAFVFWGYGMSLLGLLNYLEIDEKSFSLIFIIVNAFAAVIFVVGVYLSIVKGSDRVQKIWKDALIKSVKAIIITLLLIALVIVLGELGII